MKSRYPLRPLGDVLTLDLDQVPVEPSCSYDIAGVYSFGRGLFARGPLPGSDTSYHVLNRLHAGALVLSRLKAFEGAVAVVPESLDGHFLSQEFPTFSSVSDEVDPTYLGYLCRWPTFWEALAGTSKGVGARRERVHAEALLAMEVPLPDLNEQHRVAQRIAALLQNDNIVGRLYAASEPYPQAILHAARSDMASPDGLKASKDRSSTCKEARLGEVAEFVNGTSYDASQLSDNGLPIIRISNISDPASEFLTTTQEFDGRFMIQAGDLLVSWSASFKSIMWPGPIGVLNQHIFRVTEIGGNNRRFIRHLIEAIFRSMRAQAVGIGMMHLRRNAFLDYPVLIPDPHTQRSIAARLDRIEEWVAEIEKKRHRAETLVSALRISVLNYAFEGLL